MLIKFSQLASDWISGVSENSSRKSHLRTEIRIEVQIGFLKKMDLTESNWNLLKEVKIQKCRDKFE